MGIRGQVVGFADQGLACGFACWFYANMLYRDYVGNIFLIHYSEPTSLGLKKGDTRVLEMGEGAAECPKMLCVVMLV